MYRVSRGQTAQGKKGTVGIAFSTASSHRREQLRQEQQQQQQRGSQETLNNAGTIAVYKMISPAADILTRLGVDHVIIGFLSILLQILLDVINHFWPVYDCDSVGPHVLHSNIGIVVGIFYMFIGVMSVKIGSFSRHASGPDARRRFATFHVLNTVNCLASATFLLASGLLLYILWLRLNGCRSVNWSVFRVLDVAGLFASSSSSDGGGANSGNTSSFILSDTSAAAETHGTFDLMGSTVKPSIQKPGHEVNEDELHAAIICAFIVNVFHGLIGTLELLMTFVGCCLRTS
ncbi:hypothetical protein BV898_08496 [Hypsibius exemplaris]|uniref:Uncharacterized protein n=1 Tax=Hypsibius exemplaris TaxID=2072580 RepID=A0A1W0WQA5_HYPEX|nr:hypothetical protein BV898_08496 [Hypsibius exemplaris]